MKVCEIPIYKRQRFLLTFISQLPDNGIKSIHLQELVFLNLMDTGETYYEFIPYKNGPYSFQLTEDINTLIRDGYVSMNAEGGLYAGKPYIYRSLDIASERGSALAKRVWKCNPYYAINGEINVNVFSDSELQMIVEERAKFKRNQQVLFTIGYEGRTIEQFINMLIKNDVKLVCDVRKNPISRKFGFSKNKLKSLLKVMNIDYYHIPELGIPSEKRTSLCSKHDYDKLFLEYSKSIDEKRIYINRVYSLLDKNLRIALMCYEQDSEMCHRHIIRDYMEKWFMIRSIDL